MSRASILALGAVLSGCASFPVTYQRCSSTLPRICAPIAKFQSLDDCRRFLELNRVPCVKLELSERAIHYLELREKLPDDHRKYGKAYYAHCRDSTTYRENIDGMFGDYCAR